MTPNNYAARTGVKAYGENSNRFSAPRCDMHEEDGSIAQHARCQVTAALTLHAGGTHVIATISCSTAVTFTLIFPDFSAGIKAQQNPRSKFSGDSRAARGCAFVGLAPRD